AGVDFKTFFGKDFQRPKRTARDRKTWRSIGRDRGAADFLQHVARTTQVRAKLDGRLLIHQFMPETVRADFMTGPLNLAHQLWMALGQPAQDEKCCADFTPRKQVE